MNGNVTKEGITADLEWMKRVGIGGAQIFDAGVQTPVVIDSPAPFMSARWRENMLHAGLEAQRLGLELAMATSGGWSESGAPWVKPEEAMKTVVWSETAVHGGQVFHAALAMPLHDTAFYADARILAFRKTAAAMPMVSGLREKAQYTVSFPDGQRQVTPAVPAASCVKPEEVIDLTTMLLPDGTLHWEAPGGDWIVLRLGYTITGVRSRAASPASEGLEVDKLSAAHVKDYFERYLGVIADATGPSFGKSLQYMLMDSWEVGHENWTDTLIAALYFLYYLSRGGMMWSPVVIYSIVGYLFLVMAYDGACALPDPRQALPKWLAVRT